jgi:phosphoenolpyruvate carboxykinase (ATP)
VIVSKAYHALFMRNMLIRPTMEQIEKDFKNGAEWTIINGGEFPADPANTPGVKTTVSVNLNIKERTLIILGSLYAGEMKKGLFTVLNYTCPKEKGLLSMHCSATEGPAGDITLYFGLSGTGKTTLSADPKRVMLGDDEHVWSEKGVFNVEGGCYAKVVDLDPKVEPDIYNALTWNCILENVIYDENTREVDYTRTDLTENTRASYPLELIRYAKIPSLGGHPKNVIFLTCDASGVMPPVSKLTRDQAQYHFINGYTSKVAGTEVGIVDPVRTFSACFGEAFIVLHPMEYAKLLDENLKKHGSAVWLVNTGWVNGPYGVGQRMNLPNTRAILDAIHDGSLEKEQYENFPIFNV